MPQEAHECQRVKDPFHGGNTAHSNNEDGTKMVAGCVDHQAAAMTLR